MEETIITITTAKLADEKGFNIPTLYAYDTVIEELTNSVFYNGDSVFDEDDIQNATENSGNKHVLAPGQSLLQKWLREVHKIDVHVIPVRFTGHEEIAYYTFAVMSEIPIKDYRYNTWEEALENALERGLEEIK